MEAVIMERPAQLVIKIIMLFFFLSLSCNRPNKELRIHYSDSDLNLFKSTVTYQDKPLSGMVFQNFEGSSTVYSTQTYRNGQKNGVWKKYFPSGRLKEVRKYKMGKKEGDFIGYFSNGAHNFIFQFTDGEYNGTNKIWTINGILIEESNFKNGYEDGAQKRWYNNGKVKSNYIIKNNRRYGLLGTQNCVNVSKKSGYL